jgi:hypothetical protein
METTRQLRDLALREKGMQERARAFREQGGEVYLKK